MLTTKGVPCGGMAADGSSALRVGDMVDWDTRCWRQRTGKEWSGLPQDLRGRVKWKSN
jgi:hypothetical protein